MSDFDLTIGIIGGGYVGSATAIFECEKVKCIIYDIDETKRNPKDCQMKDVVNCDIIFICVPTPIGKDGQCDINIIDNVITQLKKEKEDLCNIVIRSTIPPFTSKRMGTHFMPEFLTEKNWQQDVKSRSKWIIGINNEKDGINIKQKMTQLINLSYEYNKINSSDILFVNCEEAECSKYIRNCFLATKVSFFNEMYNYCEALNLSYDTIRSLVVLDNRIGESHTHVPGHDGLFGFGGTCFPKDLAALNFEFKSKGINNNILNAVQQRNIIDRQK